MDQRNPYGLPTAPNGRGGIPGAPMQPQRGGMMPQQYMSEMLFDPMAMPMANGMYHHAAPHHPHGHPHAQMQHRMPPHGVGNPMFHQPPMMAENDPHFVDDIMNALGPGDLGDPVGMGGQMPSVYDQSHLMRSQHPQARQQPPMGLPTQSPQQQQAQMQAQRMPNQRAMPTHPGMGNPMHMGQPGQMPPNGMQGVNALHGVPRMPQSQPMPAQSTTSALGGMNRRQPVASSASPAGAAMNNPSALVPANPSRPASTSSVDTRALTTTSSTGLQSNSEDEMGMGGDEDVNKKKERRRQQVRYASRRRRKKQKDEESFLRDRIEELKEQIRIIGGDLSEQCSQMAGMSEQALTEAYEKQMQTVQNLRRDNNKLKEQLLQHENFARMIQYGLNALPSDCRDVDRKKIPGMPTWFSDHMGPLKGPTLVVDLNLCHDAVRVAYNELKSFGPSVNSKTNVCFAMGWRTELWATGTCLSFKATRTINDRNIREVTESSWEIITSPDKCKRIYPDVKQFRVLQKVNDDIVVVHRIASVASDHKDREFISVAFRFADGNNYFVGLKTISVQTECSENCIRGEECQGWMFTGDQEEATNWKAHFLGYYDVKGEKDDKVLNQLANEAMFGMLRWESEAMHPLSV
ncbi:hypothetical protein Poli38472_005729 [Pythium oligandrum]|uniref:BZIP domain-containing protein n=1 Tax=Pythium oligandrum TaxID=41045 RepID=A0A8K1CTC9_PYTOL|nr:hypothetical protein Poli38472_005729 [Pythium oligandrum]|eukprot:TMW68261.1 hypothetical protein Poli38472_005729 [Pythium oligandrum]